MSMKKNNRHLIGLIQEASYLLLIASGRKDASTKSMVNQGIMALKKEAKKLKSY